MTIQSLEEYVKRACWFSNLGNFQDCANMIAIKTIEAWTTEDTTVDPRHEYIADNMQWLPSDSSEEDPIHQPPLRLVAETLGKSDELRRLSLELDKQTLSALRNVPDNPLLVTGPHNLNGSARKSACYAFRLAAAEVVVGEQGFWCSLIPVFVAGNLPCGLMPDGKIVVF
jgi:hypothetical protein